jgi:hypothetical protein
MVENIMPKKYFLTKISLTAWLGVDMITAILLELEPALELKRLKKSIKHKLYYGKKSIK